MVLFNHSTRELTAKIVYYGPGLSGKTTNLKVLHERLERGTVGRLLSLSTAQDRTIYFDLLPVELGNIKGYTVRFQLCTVPGQVYYNETRKLVLRGVDGIVYTVDSQWSMLSHNLESFQNLRENLRESGVAPDEPPLVVQYNKRDIPGVLSVEALQSALNFQSYPYVEAVASEGTGVIETFKLISKLTFVDLLRRLQRQGIADAETGKPVTLDSGITPRSIAPPEPIPRSAVISDSPARFLGPREEPAAPLAESPPAPRVAAPEPVAAHAGPGVEAGGVPSAEPPPREATPAAARFVKRPGDPLQEDSSWYRLFPRDARRTGTSGVVPAVSRPSGGSETPASALAEAPAAPPEPQPTQELPFKPLSGIFSRSLGGDVFGEPPAESEPPAPSPTAAEAAPRPAVSVRPAPPSAPTIPLPPGAVPALPGAKPEPHGGTTVVIPTQLQPPQAPPPAPPPPQAAAAPQTSPTLEALEARFEKLRAELSSSLESKLSAALGERLRAEIRDDLFTALRADLSSNLSESVGQSLGASLSESLSGSLAERLTASLSADLDRKLVSALATAKAEERTSREVALAALRQDLSALSASTGAETSAIRLLLESEAARLAKETSERVASAAGEAEAATKRVGSALETALAPLRSELESLKRRLAEPTVGPADLEAARRDLTAVVAAAEERLGKLELGVESRRVADDDLRERLATHESRLDRLTRETVETARLLRERVEATESRSARLLDALKKALE